MPNTKWQTRSKNHIRFLLTLPLWNRQQQMVYTHPADFGWSDLDNWASLHDKLSKDENNNGAVGSVKLYECTNCVVHAENAKKVVLQGLDGYIVSEKNGQILVCKRSEEQRIRDFSVE